MVSIFRDPGMDKGKEAEGYVNHYSDLPDDGEGQGSEPLISMTEVLAELQDGLFKKGYRLIPSVGGMFCNCRLYRKTTVKEVMSGVSLGEYFWYWKEVQPTDTMLVTNFQGHVRRICQAGLDESQSKAERSIWKELDRSLHDHLTDNKVTLAKLTASTSGRVYKTVTIDGTAGAFKVALRRKWFPQLANLDPLELLNILPQAEAKMLMLILGRMMVGANGTECLETGKISHGFRSYGIIIGEPGIGKSTLITYIRNCILNLGYITTEIAQTDTRFGWGTVATSDLATTDDLTAESQKVLLRNPNIKSIVSNNTLRVEEKGLPGVDVRATSVILACSNSHNYKDYIGLDPGILNRLNQLSCYTVTELEERHGTSIKNCNTYATWEALASRYNTDTNNLAAYLLASSTELFLETVGYDLDSLKKSKGTLEDTIREIRKEYRIDTNLRHANELPIVAVDILAWSLSQLALPRQRQYLDKVPELMFSPEVLWTTIKVFMEAPRDLPEWASELKLQELSADVKRYLTPKRSDIENNLHRTQTIDAAFKAIAINLVSTKGINYPQSMGFYDGLWRSAIRNLPQRMKYWEQLSLANSDKPIPVCLQGSLDGIIQVLNQL